MVLSESCLLENSYICPKKFKNVLRLSYQGPPPLSGATGWEAECSLFGPSPPTAMPAVDTIWQPAGGAKDVRVVNSKSKWYLVLVCRLHAAWYEQTEDQTTSETSRWPRLKCSDTGASSTRYRRKTSCTHPIGIVYFLLCDKYNSNSCTDLKHLSAIENICRV